MGNLLNELKGLIHANNLNISKVARLIGLKESTLILKFSRRNLKAEELEKICTAMGYKVTFTKDDKK